MPIKIQNGRRCSQVFRHYLISKNPDLACEYISKFCDFSNQTLRNSDILYRRLQEELDYARLYLELEKMRYEEKLVYNISIAPGIDTQIEIPTYRLCYKASFFIKTFRTFAAVTKIFTVMQTATITSPVTTSSPKRAETTSKPLIRTEARRLGDLHAISLIEEGLKSGRVSREQVMKSLKR